MSVSSTTAQVEKAEAALEKAWRRIGKVAAEENKLHAEKKELLHLALAVCRIKESGRQITDAAHKEGLRACGITRVGNVDNVLAGLKERLLSAAKRLESTEAQMTKPLAQVNKATKQHKKAIMLQIKAIMQETETMKQHFLAMARAQAPQATALDAQGLREALPAFEVPPGTAQELSESDKEVDAATAYLRGVEAQPGPLRCHRLEKRTSSGTTSRNVPATRKIGKHAAKSSVSAAKRRRTHTR
eukprot:Rhum_TRINITY_DN14208_c0_g1::Rhum_TRINITY_DN14208_c0_g1_i3::g.73584::m.73584